MNEYSYKYTEVFVFVFRFKIIWFPVNHIIDMTFALVPDVSFHRIVFVI